MHQKIYALLLSLLLALPAAMAQSQTGDRGPQLSPYTRMVLSDHQARPQGRVLADGRQYLAALLQVSAPDEAAQSLRHLGAPVGTRAGNIWTVQLPVDSLNAIRNLRGIRYLELGEPAKPDLDQARKKTRADSVQKGIGLPMPYLGDGVMIGVVDFGFDYNHPTFYDTLGGRYRIQAVWELGGTGTPPNGYAYGHEISDTTLIKAQGTDNAKQTHGTATAGIAAGSGWGSLPQPDKFRGMAPMSNLVLASVRRDSIEGQWLQGTFPDFVDAIAYIFSKATAAGKPCVVNVSWGSQSGPHDGSTLLNQAINNLCGPGRLVVMSAGNEGEEHIHLKKSFGSADTSVQTFVTFEPYGDTVYQRTWLDAWGEPGKNLCAEVMLWKDGAVVSTSGRFCIDDQIHTLSIPGTNSADSCKLRFITNTAEPNGKPRMTVDIFNQTTDTVLVHYTSSSGTWHVWNEYYYYGYQYRYKSAFDSLGYGWARRGDTLSTVSDMGSGDSVLLVGAYASKTNFKDINGNNWSYSGYVATNKLVPFSSRGPLSNGTVKPDITAPGLTLTTATSSYDTSYTPTGSNSQLTVSRWVTPANDTFYYAEFTGTSASAPAASGIVALMLQVKPNLSVKEMKEILFASAIKDNYTGALPPEGNNAWGHGKINAYGAVKALVQSMTVVSTTGSMAPDCVLFPNPSADGRFVLDYTGSAATLDVSVADLSGRQVQRFSWAVAHGQNQRTLNLQGLPAGMYLVKIAGPQGATGIKAMVR